MSDGTAVAEAVNACRDMATEPANYMTPTRMAELALTFAQESGLEIEVFDRPQMAELGHGGATGSRSRQ